MDMDVHGECRVRVHGNLVNAFRYVALLVSSCVLDFIKRTVGMLACGLDVRITFDKSLTILSAVVAILFTFAAFTSGYATDHIENSVVAHAVGRFAKSIRTSVRSSLYGHPPVDPELGYEPVAGSEHGENDRRSVRASTSDRAVDDDEDEEEQRRRSDEYDIQVNRAVRPPFARSQTLPTMRSDLALPRTSEEDTGETAMSEPVTGIPHTEPMPTPPSQRGPWRFFWRTSSAPAHPNDATEGPSSARNSEESTPLTTSDSDSSMRPTRRLSTGSHDHSLSSATFSSRSWSEPLHAGLSREARIRIKAQARDKPVPTFGWKYWFKTYYKSATLLVAIRASIWAVAIVFMHYCGMWAMEIPEGRISWDWSIVILSYIVAFSVCFIGCIAMVHMEVHFGRQVAFSTIASIGTCSMHYTGAFPLLVRLL